MKADPVTNRNMVSFTVPTIYLDDIGRNLMRNDNFLALWGEVRFNIDNLKLR